MFTLKTALVSSTVAILVVAAASPASAAVNCSDLANLKIPASDIWLPSGGATIASAQTATVPLDPLNPGATRDYCKVLGAVAPVDPNAPPVNFEVNLPAEWNGKAVQYGGGGSNGVLITGLAPLRDARRDTPVPVARGFATWGTDSGHDNSKLAEPRAFALNDEALVNMAYASYKKTHDVGVRIATAFYGRAPSKIYFYGGSEGGREALRRLERGKPGLQLLQIGLERRRQAFGDGHQTTAPDPAVTHSGPRSASAASPALTLSISAPHRPP